MSQYAVEARNPDIDVSIVIGWDAPMATYFVQVTDHGAEGRADRDDDDLVLWRGRDVGELPDVPSLQLAVSAYADIPPDVIASLRGDRVRESKINSKRSVMRSCRVYPFDAAIRSAWGRHIAPHRTSLPFPLAKRLAHRVFDSLGLPRPFVKVMPGFYSDLGYATPEWEIFVHEETTDDTILHEAAHLLTWSRVVAEEHDDHWLRTYTLLVARHSHVPARAIRAFLGELNVSLDPFASSLWETPGTLPFNTAFPPSSDHWRALVPGGRHYETAISAGCQVYSRKVGEPLPHRDGEGRVPDCYVVYDYPRQPPPRELRLLGPKGRYGKGYDDNLFYRLFKQHFGRYERVLSFAEAKAFAHEIFDFIRAPRPFVKGTARLHHRYFGYHTERWEMFIGDKTTDLNVIQIAAHILHQPDNPRDADQLRWIMNFLYGVIQFTKVPEEATLGWLKDLDKATGLDIAKNGNWDAKMGGLVDAEVRHWASQQPGMGHYELAVRECCHFHKIAGNEPAPLRDPK